MGDAPPSKRLSNQGSAACQRSIRIDFALGDGEDRAEVRVVEGASFVDQCAVPAGKTLIEAFASLTITHQVIEAVAFPDELLATLLEDASEGEVACSDALGRD